MKRRITELEQRLIDNGFTLFNKTYKGKNSTRTDCYVYCGVVYCYSVFVYLDYKREKLDHYVIQNTLPQFIRREQLDELEKVYQYLFELFYDHHLAKYDEDSEEIVEIVEANEDE